MLNFRLPPIKAPIRQPADLWPRELLDEFRRMAAAPLPPVRLEIDPTQVEWFKCVLQTDNRYSACFQSGSDWAALLASVAWLREGPKIADVTAEQFAALARIEIRLTVADFRMPYPTLLINIPPGHMHNHVILHLTKADDIPIVIGCSMSHDFAHDIVTVIRDRGYDNRTIEDSLVQFHSNVTDEEATQTHVCMRVAMNMALAMTNFGCQAEYLFPKEVQRERRYIAKGDRSSREGRRASDRLREQPQLVTLNREVQLYHRLGSHEPGTPTGAEMPFHWRRGHWRMARVGLGRTERRMLYVRPCMVRGDLLSAPTSDTTTVYHKE